MIGGRDRHLDDLKVAVIGEAVREPREKKTPLTFHYSMLVV